MASHASTGSLALTLERPAQRADSSRFFAGTSNFTTVANHESAKPSNFALESAVHTSDEHSGLAGHNLDELRKLFAHEQAQFSKQLERQLDSFYSQTASRLDSLAEEIIRHFSEELSAHCSQALTALMTDWAEQNRALVDAECNRALDQFSMRLQRLSSAQIESYRKEMQNLSSNLKDRLRGVAHALQDIGPVSHHGT